MHNKTFRLFISSTFSDFKREREVMQTKVFPEIEAYCASYGYQFQAIDLRWGVNEEAQLDQKTIEICLKEVNTCKHYPHPNFLIMLGNRYGWLPLPYAIEKTEFERILDYYSGNEERQLFLKEWYQPDENHLMTGNSTAYVIRPRGGRFTEYNNWEKAENLLREILQKAVANIDSITDTNKYFISATEHEVIEGVYPYGKHLKISNKPDKKNDAQYFFDLEYICGFIRVITTGEYETSKSVFFDSENENLKKFRKNLKKTLKKENLLELKTFLVSPDKVDENYLEIFKEGILHYLKSSVAKQIKNIADSSVEENTKTEHLAFKQERLKVFVGREGILKKIHNYISESSDAPLVIYGKSGMGKTALMAKAIDNAGNSKANKLIYRFVGASEKSSNIRDLLISIIKDIDTKKAVKLESIFNDDIFNDQVASILSEINLKAVIFIDALDQLFEKSYLKWLPDELSPQLKLIVSVLEDEHYKNDSGYLDQLKVKFNRENHQNNFIQLKPLEREDGSEILKKLLEGINRTATDQQIEFVLDKFEESGCSPLYLTIAFEEVRNWKSFDTSFKKKLKHDIVNSINTFIENLSQIYHHQKTLVDRSLGYLVCSKNGLSEKEILDILSSDVIVVKTIENQFHKNLSGKLPIAPWARLFSQLSPFLIEKMSDNVSLITLFHRQFINAISTSFLSESSVKKSLHQNIAQYFKNQPLITSEGIYNLRKLSEQAFQLFHSDQVDEMLKLIGQDYIRIKYELGRLYECLYEIEQTFILINNIKDGDTVCKDRLFSSLLRFFNSYSLEKAELFDFELIHNYFVYRKSSNFYNDFLKSVTDKERIRVHFTNNAFLEDYHLLFLSGFVGYLRRNAMLKDAARYVNEIIKEYRKKLDTKKDNSAIKKQLSSSYYELGYIFYLTGNFEDANSAFSQSVDFAQKINNVVGEWITKCIMSRIAFLGGLISVEKFDNTLGDAFAVFKSLESTNSVAKRWIMVTQHHKFEISFFKKDIKMMTRYYNFLRTNEWNQEFDVAMDLYEAQMALIEGKYKKSINSFNNYIHKFTEARTRKEEAFAEVFYNLGLAYYKTGDINNARLTWEKALALGDEPGNHIFKKRSREKLIQLQNK